MTPYFGPGKLADKRGVRAHADLAWGSTMSLIYDRRSIRAWAQEFEFYLCSSSDDHGPNHCRWEIVHGFGWR